LRTIKKKREEGFKPVYLDETWCDTNHTTSHQWAAEDDSKNRKQFDAMIFVQFHFKLPQGNTFIF
jgi:hypothetical protein